MMNAASGVSRSTALPHAAARSRYAVVPVSQPLGASGCSSGRAGNDDVW